MVDEIQKRFVSININEEWSFTDSHSNDNWTHGYHRYPAKFIPHLVKKLIEKYSSDGDVIEDVFAGCGTTLVESKVHGRKSVGVDINPIAQLITNAKIHPLNPIKLEET